MRMKFLRVGMFALLVVLLATFVVACGETEEEAEVVAADVAGAKAADAMAMDKDAMEEDDHAMEMEEDAMAMEEDAMAMDKDAMEEDDHAMEMEEGAMEAEEHDAHDDVPHGVVNPKPADATQVDVILAEWSIVPTIQTISAGATYFLANNLGPLHPHELVIIRTDLAPNELPTVDGAVDETAVEIIGEIEEFALDSSASGVFDLEPGSYVLICNVTETEGELENHYEEGMAVAFTVN